MSARSLKHVKLYLNILRYREYWLNLLNGRGCL